MKKFYLVPALWLLLSHTGLATAFVPGQFIVQAYEQTKPSIYNVNIKIIQASYEPSKPNITYTPNIKAIVPKKEKKIQAKVKTKVLINDKYLVKNVNYLYKMGYLPFYIEEQTKTDASAKNPYYTLVWDANDVPPKLMQLVEDKKNNLFSKSNILYKSAMLRFAEEYKIKFNFLNTSLSSILLKEAYKSGFKTKKPFVWVYVDQHIPQKVYAWQNGKFVFESPVNTGVMGTTNVGTYMVYLRFKKTEMKGTFPGSDKTYDDPDVPWVNYFYKGEALHGFPRKRYGYPQSAGCVELPIQNAKELYKILYKYAVVTVSNYDKTYLATHPYKAAQNPATQEASFKVINPLRLGF
jgi:hypothetical protein